MNKLLLFIFLSFSTFSWSQENSNSSDIIVSPEDLQASGYINDSTANAFYIFEKGFSRIQDGGNFNLLTDYSAKIKILNQEGYDFGYMDSFSFFVHLEIPETHEFKDLPEQKVLRLPESGGNLQFMVQQMDKRNVSVQFRFSFAKASYSSSYYPVLKEFLERIIEVETQSIILVQEIL